jgi:hypothetical protein
MPIRVGLIGLNYGSQVHIPAFKANPKYELVALCARTPGQAEKAAREFNVARWYSDARQLIASDLDLISIASPPRTHSGLAAAALSAGKHALVEIAFAPSALDAQVLIGMARDFKRVGAAAFAFRYSPSLRLVSDLLARQVIGRPRLMRFDFFTNFLALSQQTYRWMWDGDNGGGVLSGFASHGVDLARRWFGPVKEVDGTLATFTDVTAPKGSGPLADDTGVATLLFESGLIGVFTHSAVTAYPHTHWELHGSDASLLIEGFGDEVSLLPMGETRLQPQYAPSNYLEGTRGQSGLPGGFTILLDELAQAIETRTTPATLPTFSDGWEVTRILDAIKLAARERRRVAVSEIG